MQRPWRVRQTRSASNPGARATPIVGGTRSRLARRIARGRPILSESGPQANPPIATASTTTETESPARDGLTSKSRESSGRIACVEYIVANMPVAPSRKPTNARGNGLAVTGLSPSPGSRPGPPCQRPRARGSRTPSGGRARQGTPPDPLPTGRRRLRPSAARHRAAPSSERPDRPRSRSGTECSRWLRAPPRPKPTPTEAARAGSARVVALGGLDLV